jgi:hypothetical protein
VVYIPSYGTIVIEVKTGENPTFTDSQRRIYPMVQLGGHVTSSKAALGSVGTDARDAIAAFRSLGLLEIGSRIAGQGAQAASA